MRPSRRATWKSSAQMLLAFAMLWISSAQAVDLGISGSARAAYFSKDLSFNGDSGFAVGSLWMTARPEEVLGIKTYFDARVQDQNLSRSSTPSWELREGYAETSLGDFDLKGGRQITVWGRADKVNPTDVWSTRDYTLLTTDDEDQRLGVSAIQIAWNHWDHRIIAYWQPEWRAPGIPITPLPPGVSIRNLTPGDQVSQFGLKLDHSGGSIDYSVSYAHAINRAPDIAILNSGAPGTALGFQFNKIDVVGADVAVVIGDYGFRAEAAYTDTQNNSGSDPLKQDNNLFGVFGVERTFEGVFNVNLQYMYRHFFNWQDPGQISDPNLRFLAQQENLASNQLGSDMHGATVHLDHKAFNETLESELAFVTWFTKCDSALRPKVTYAFTDHFKGAVGGQIYLGPQDSFFGRLNTASTIFTELRWNF